VRPFVKTLQQFHEENHFWGYVVPMEHCWYCQRNRAVCRSKVVYTDPRVAYEASMEINIRERFAKPIATYRCRECLNWHLTSKPNTTRRRRWRKQMRKLGMSA